VLTFEIDWGLTFAENYLKELPIIPQPIAKSYWPNWQNQGDLFRQVIFYYNFLKYQYDMKFNRSPTGH
jgi:hypothetical protein